MRYRDWWAVKQTSASDPRLADTCEPRMFLSNVTMAPEWTISHIMYAARHIGGERCAIIGSCGNCREP
jgi:hypothetical protein